MIFVKGISLLLKKMWRLFKKEEAEDISFEKIPLYFISEKLLSTAKKNRINHSGSSNLPTGFVVNFSPEDRALRKSVEDILVKELKKILDKELQKWGVEKPKSEINVSVETDAALNKGDFSINCKHDIRSSMKYPVYEKNKLFKAVPFSRNDLSRTCIPPPEATKMKNGRFVSRLLNPDQEPDITMKSGHDECCLLEIKDQEKKRKMSLKEGTYCIGRGRDADIQLNRDDHSLSRKHLILNVSHEGITVTMEGKNGGKVNTGAVEKGAKCLLISGDKIYIGNTVLTLIKEEVF